MIDFVSTREGVDPATRAAARMVAALVAEHIRAASSFPNFEEIAAQRNFNANARQSIEYLFAPGSPFEEHMELLGGSAAVVRAALQSDRPLAGTFTERHREAIRLRLSYWRKDHPL